MSSSELSIEDALAIAINLHKAGDLEAADRYYTAILKVNPNHPDACHNLAVIASSLQKYSLASDFFQKAINHSPNTEQFWISAVNNLAAEKNINELNLLKLQLYRKDLDQSLQDSIIRLLEAVTSEVSASLLDAEMLSLFHKKEYASVIETFNTKSENVIPSLKTLNIFGASLIECSQFKDAVECYTSAIEISNDIPELHYNLGNCYKFLKSFDLAISSYLSALALNPNYVEALNNAGICYSEMGDFESAINNFTKAVSLEPHYSSALSGLGICFLNLGQFRRSANFFFRSLRYDKSVPQTFLNLGIVLDRLGFPSRSLTVYRYCTNRFPTFVKAINNLALQQICLGEFENALASLVEILQIEPSYLNAWNNLYFPLRTQLLAGETSLADIEDLLKDVKSEQPLSYFTLMHRLKKGLREGAQSHVDLVEHVRESKDYILGNAVPDNNEGSLVGALKGEPIALLHFGRSGSGFLHSLIDGHPEISTLPSIFLSEFFDLETWRDLKKDGISELAGRFVDHYEVLFDSRSKKPIATKSGQKLYDFGEKEGLNNLGENKNSYISLDKKKFITILQSLIDKEPYLSQARLFELVHEAVDRLASRSSDGKKIFYHIHNPDTLAYAHYISCFPKGKVLVIVRDPIQSCESWASKSGDDYLKTCQRIIQMLHDIDDPVYGMVDSAAIKLEDIKKSPQASLQELCGWMGISYSESLSKMTVMGKRWWGDPTSPDYRVDGMEPFGTTSIMRETTDFFNKQDREILETLFFPFSSAFEYTTKSEAEFINDLKLLPTKIDNLFEFERRFLDARPFDENELRQMGYFRYLRAEMLNKWKVLSEYGTYPNLIPWIKNVVK